MIIRKDNFKNAVTAGEEDLPTLGRAESTLPRI